MKTFGQVIREARKAACLTQKAVAEALRRGKGRKVLPPYLNDLEHDRCYPPEDAIIEQLATESAQVDGSFKEALRVEIYLVAGSGFEPLTFGS
jgi:transcriptional regulator with XRE-family HTH domain